MLILLQDVRHLVVWWSDGICDEGTDLDTCTYIRCVMRTLYIYQVCCEDTVHISDVL